MANPYITFLSLSCLLSGTLLARIHRKEWKGSGCPPPGLTLHGRRVTARANAAPDYSTVGEVRFSAEFAAPVQFGPLKKVCKIKCIGGEWVGPLCQQDPDAVGGTRYQPLLRSCIIVSTPPHTIVSYRNVTITPRNEVFPHNSMAQFRCKEPLGMYKLLGESELQCNNGVWNHRLPSCIPTTLLTNYTEDSPPTILIRIPSGSASVEPSGVLAVFPETILHLDCLFSRKIGNPEWTWTSTYRQYLTGWAIAAEEREWKYRLSIYYTKTQDTGVFTCQTPRGLTNSLNVQVLAVECDLRDVVSPDRHIKSRVEGNKLGQVAHFQCPLGFRLNGTSNLTCQASGRWSSPVPRCEPIVCPDLATDDPYLRLAEYNTSYGGRAVFTCPWGFRMAGPPGLECELNGLWSGPLPSCKAIRCTPPVVPLNGRLVEDATPGIYGVGAVIQFSCSERHQLVGEASIVCIETGVWSHPPPFCKPKCDYPGEPANGRIVPLKFSYDPGDHLKVTCHAGFVSRLDARPTCQPDGTWSEPVPECTNYRDV
ncbi:locomotion-related protein Hikaru genki [Homalodisca vitripennis]|nr:locomotion-related protein Hikaru genki [Homalodisca vitripennis]